MLHYERQGTGEVLILIHGFLGGNTIFNKVIEPLQENFDVIRIDLPGHGKSPVEREQYTVYDYVEAIAEVLKHEYVEEAYWLGHSMGGYITLAAIENNLPIKKAVLAYSSDAPDTDEAKKKRTGQQEEIQKDGVKKFVDSIIEAFLANDPREHDVLYAKEVAYDATEDGLVVALDAMMGRPDQRTLINQTRTPILVIQGTEDEAVTPIETENPSVTKVFTKTGHLGMLEDPGAFVKEVLVFLK